MARSEILGAKELQRVLRKLPDQLQQNALKATSRAGAKELQRVAFAHLAVAMVSRSPREDDVVIRQRRNRSGRPQAIYDVGPPKRKPQLRWLHDGTEPHLISAVTKYGTRRGARNVAYGAREGRILTNKSTVFGKEVSHPGQPARPWLKTAVFSSRDSMLRAMGHAMRRALPRQVKKLVSTEYRSASLRKFLR